MGFLKNFFRRKDAAKRDAQRLYFGLLAQSRRPAFYGETRIPDTYDGRVDLLTLHLSVIMRQLRTHGEAGQLLSQAVFDVMKDDFEVALREEGITDTGVKKRIKPMIEFFYARLKSYTEALEAEAPQSALINIFANSYDEGVRMSFWPALSDYTLELNLELKSKSLGEVAMMDFDYTPIPDKREKKS